MLVDWIHADLPGALLHPRQISPRRVA
jgi:hypothetical protein